MILPIISTTDVNAVKAMNQADRDDLKEKINGTDPHSIFQAAGDSRNPDVRKIICPECGNGEGRDGTPVEATRKNGTWLYNCFRCNAFSGDLLKIITNSAHLTPKGNFEDMCKALAIGATLIGYPLPDPTPKKNKPTIKHKEDYEELPLIKADITEAQQHLDDLPESQRRGLNLKTFSEFKCGFLQKWRHPCFRVKSYEGKIPAPSRRFIIPTADLKHYNAVALPADRPGMSKKYIKMHAGEKLEAFNSPALYSDAELIVVVEGEFDAMSVWQASDGNIAVVATLGTGGYKELLLPLIAEQKVQDKKFLILFDGGDDAGRTNAEKLRQELLRLDTPAVAKFLFNFLTPEDKQVFGNKVDANQILQEHGDEFLNQLMKKIVEEAQRELDDIAEEIATRANDNALTAEQRGFLFTGDLSDDDFAKRIIFMYGDRIRYLENPTDEWLIFKRNELRGGVWNNAGEKNSVLFPFANELADKLIANAEDKEERTFGRKLKDTKKKNSSIAAIKGIRKIIIMPEDLDNHPFLINVKNGVVDLTNGKLLEADPALLFTRQANAIYRPGYRNELVEKFLRDILPDEPTREAVIRFLGYVLFGLIRDHVAHFWRGDGRNGKSTLINLLLYLLNTYAVKLPTSAFLYTGKPTDPNQATPALNPLEGARLAICNELPRNATLDSATFKTLIAGDEIAIRPLHCEFKKIKPYAKFIFNGNFLPELDATADFGLEERLRNVPYTETFTGDRADKHLMEKLLTPDALSGMFSILVDAAQMWDKYGLLESEAMKAAKRAYIADNNFIGEFLEEYCKFGADLSIPRKALLERLKEEYPAECLRQFNNSDRALSDAIRRIPGIGYRRGGKDGGRKFYGVGWTSAKEQRADDWKGQPVDPNDTPF